MTNFLCCVRIDFDEILNFMRKSKKGITLDRRGNLRIKTFLLAFLLVFCGAFAPAGAAFASDANRQETQDTSSQVVSQTEAQTETAGKSQEDAEKPAKETKENDKEDSEKPEPARLTIMLTGDLMCQPLQQQRAFDGEKFDFAPTFKYVKQIFDESDIVIGNLETLVSKSLPLSKDINRVQNKPYLNAPTEWLDALKDAGFDGFITANNHACDGGKTGIIETLEALDSYGFAHTGTFRSKEEKRYFTMEQNGIKIGVISYAAYYNLKDKFLTSQEQSYMLNRPLQAAMNADVDALRKEGAEYIIAYNHSGTEYSQVPAARQERYGLMLAQAGVDYIIGSHPHVLQPYEPLRYTDFQTPYIYSMGNFTSAMLDPITKETLILSLTLEKDEDGKVTLAKQKYYPCYMLDEYEKEPFVLIPEDKDYNGNLYEDAPKALVSQLKESFKHIRKIVGKLK